MDFTPIFQQLVEAPPEANAAVGVLIGVIKAVAVEKYNNVNLNLLIHEAATRLVIIAEYTHGQWDHAPGELKACLDEFTDIFVQYIDISWRFLQKLLKVAKKSLTSSWGSVLRYRTREQQIMCLADELRNFEYPIFVIFPVLMSEEEILKLHLKLAIRLNTLLTMNEVLSRLASRADVRLLANSNSPLALMGRNTIMAELAGTDLVYYIKEEFTDIRLICPDHSPLPEKAPDYLGVSVTLHEAHHKSGRAFIVKKYEGHGKNESQERKQKTNNVERFQDWLTRTIGSCPTETIEGLYHMQLIDFQLRRKIRCALPLFSSGVVGRHMWGETALGYSDIDIVSDFRPQKGISIICGFLAGALYWMSDTATNIHSVVTIDRQMTIEDVGKSLFAHQWLGPVRALVQCDVPIALGDIGYIPNASSREIWKFQVLGNIHNLMLELPLASNSICPYKLRPADAPRWEYEECNKPILPEPDIITFEGRPVYKRYTLTYDGRPATSVMNYHYSWISPSEVWKFFSRHVLQFVSDHNLSISPYELRLATLVNVESGYLLELDKGDIAPPWDESCTSEVASVPIHHCQPPTVYVFEPLEECVFKCSGEPVVSKIIRASFSPEPDWIHESPWPVNTENRDGFTLTNNEDYLIEYYQLPMGTAA
ncbi:hypothetical protein BU17DRAFT_70630 [Hysterangium stoloniferum]|nr:hypothetical protein BU17DRAFT_70630 [Hysterangium stoloniferum]